MSYDYLKIVLPKFRLYWCIDKVPPILSKMVGFFGIWTQYSATVGHINCYAVLKKVMLFRCLCRYVIWESKGSYE